MYEFYVGFMCFEVSLSSIMWYVYVWFKFTYFGLEKKFYGYFEHENEDLRTRFFSVSKFELIVLDILNVFL